MGYNRFVEHLDEEETRPKSSSALLLNGVSGLVRFDSPGMARTCWGKPRLGLLQPQGERVIHVLSSTSGKTQGAQAQSGGFCSLDFVLQGLLRQC